MPKSLPTERRVLTDRRARPTSPFTLVSLSGSRAVVRRQADRSRLYYVDRYSRRDLVVVSACLLLSVADGFLTLQLLGLGAAEINPLMHTLLRLGPLHFVLLKHLLTAFGVTCLLIHKNYLLIGNRIPLGGLLIGLVLLYAGVVGYECLLLLGWRYILP